MTQQPDHQQEPRSTLTIIALRSLDTSVSGNAQAFGFSITVTVTFGALTSQGAPGPGELFGFALSAVAAFSLLNLLVAALRRREGTSPEPSEVVLVATATDFLAVGAAIGATLGIRSAVPGWPAWILAPLCAGLLYVIVQSIQLTVGVRQALAQQE